MAPDGPWWPYVAVWARSRLLSGPVIKQGRPDRDAGRFRRPLLLKDWAVLVL